MEDLESVYQKEYDEWKARQQVNTKIGLAFVIFIGLFGLGLGWWVWG